MRKLSNSRLSPPHTATVNETAEPSCYDKEFLDVNSCTNMACPYHKEEGPVKCCAAAGCPGYEAPKPRRHFQPYPAL